jgi:glycosyltransferase involved in cell wall biosynthesis
MELLKKIANRPETKVIVVYDIIPHIFRDYYKPEFVYYEYFDSVKKNFDIIVCISYSTKNDLCNIFGFDKNKIIVYYPEINDDFIYFNKNYEKTDISNKFSITKKYIISPLGYDFRKNYINTILSFLLWNNLDYQLVFMFIIDENGKNDIYKNIPNEYIDRQNDIIFTGFVSDEDYKVLIYNADLTLFPSLYEGFGYCVMESIYLGTPVLTSDISSTKELSELSPTEVYICDPNNINDIAQKMDNIINNLRNIKLEDKILYKKCYIQNNLSFTTQIFNFSKSKNIIDINSYKLSDEKIRISTYYKYLQLITNISKVKIFNVNLSMEFYNCILNIVDINIQVRLSNGGGGSGCVTDSCFLNKYIITTQDLYDNCISKDYENVIISTTTKNNDWTYFDDSFNNGGYSNTDIENIANKIVLNKNKIKQYYPGINNELNKRLADYSQKLISFLNINYNSKICFVTPYGDDNSGISDFSFTTINDLSNYLQYIDIYTDCTNINTEKQNKNISFYKIDDLITRKDNYDEIIWVIGNSTFHNKMIINGINFGGTFLIHDETLYELYCWNKWFNLSLQQIHPFKLREMGSNIDYSYLCFNDITKNPNNKFIVHNYNFEKILRQNYNVNNIVVLEYPNFNLNIMNKYNENQLKIYKKAFHLKDETMYLLVIGGISEVKLPNYAFKLLDKLIEKGIDTELLIFYNK